MNDLAAPVVARAPGTAVQPAGSPGAGPAAAAMLDRFATEHPVLATLPAWNGSSPPPG